MLLSEAKQILKKAGFLMESNTKDLVKTFWDKRKNGDTLTKEEAEELLNAPDFDTVVNPKYQNFIKSTCNKILGIAKPEKPKEEPKAEPIQGPNEDVVKLSEEFKKCFEYSNYEKVDLDGWINYYVRDIKHYKEKLEAYKKFLPKLTDKTINNLFVPRSVINDALKHLDEDIIVIKKIIDDDGKTITYYDNKSVQVAPVTEMKKLLSYIENVYRKLSESKASIVEKYETVNANIIKTLVKKFWAAKKGGPKLTKEEVELFYKLNSFSSGLDRVFEKVCGKYCDYIRKNFDKYSEVYQPPEEDDDPWAGVETMSDAQLKRWGHWH